MVFEGIQNFVRAISAQPAAVIGDIGTIFTSLLFANGVIQVVGTDVIMNYMPASIRQYQSTISDSLRQTVLFTMMQYT